MVLDEIYNEIKNVNTVCILAHENPDGDAIGSSMGLYHVLTEMGKKVEVLLNKVPKNYSYIPDIDKIKSETETKKFDMAIVVDCPEIKRVCEDHIKYFEEANVTVEFDHHINNAMFADYNVVNHVAPACCQILVSSLDYLDVKISNNAMTCFLTGVITDTGGFKNSGTSVESFEIAERAIEYGLDYSKIYRDSLCTVTKNRFEFQKIAMDRMEFFCDDRIAFTYISMEDDKKFKLEPGDHEGIVEIGRSIEGVEVSIFIHEIEKGYKISLRSNEYVEVSEVCRLLGGGGHIRAAGATSHLSLEDTKKLLVKEIEKRLK